MCQLAAGVNAAGVNAAGPSPLLSLSQLACSPRLWYCVALQTFWNCWNNGVNINLASPTYRRCATFRQSTVPPLVSADCQAGGGAQFNDFNFALTGFQGQPGDGALP